MHNDAQIREIHSQVVKTTESEYNRAFGYDSCISLRRVNVNRTSKDKTGDTIFSSTGRLYASCTPLVCNAQSRNINPKLLFSPGYNPIIVSFHTACVINIERNRYCKSRMPKFLCNSQVT